MELRKRTVLILCLLSCAIGAGIATYTVKPQVVSKIETVEKDKIVTVVRTVKQPDGTVVQDKTITQDRVKQVEQQVVEQKVPPQWRITGGYQFGQQNYMLGIERRIMGPLFLGVQGRTDGSILATLSVEF